MTEIQKYAQNNAMGSLLTEDGTPDIHSIRRSDRPPMVPSSSPYSKFIFNVSQLIINFHIKR